jgi:predicted nucleic acid-binding protein
MARRRLILDTSVLIRQWQRRREGRPFEQIARAEVELWARELIDLHESAFILWPVRIEFIAGERSSIELHLARAFLEQFTVPGTSLISEADWNETQHIAQRVPRDGKPRQLGDCLIRAVARRLRYDVFSYDQDFPV